MFRGKDNDGWPPEVLEAAHTAGYGSNPNEGLENWLLHQPVQVKPDAPHRGRDIVLMVVMLLVGGLGILGWFSERASTYEVRQTVQTPAKDEGVTLQPPSQTVSTAASVPDPPMEVLFILTLWEGTLLVVLATTIRSGRKPRRKQPGKT